jgi:hypothetical protein
VADLHLHFCFAHHCAVCHAALPDLQRFEDKHWAEVTVSRKNCALFKWQPGGVEITKTPTYVLTDSAGTKVKGPFVGAMTLKQLEKWVGEI